MSVIGDLVSKCCDLSVGAVALALGDPSGGQLAASALGGLTSIGVGMWASCEDRTRDRAMNRALANLGKSGAFTEDALKDAATLLGDKQTCLIDPARLSSLATEQNLAKGGAEYLVSQMQPAPDPGTADILRVALQAGIETCLEDQAFLQKLTFEFVRDIARGQGVELRVLERIETKIDALPQQIADLLRQQGLVSDTGGVDLSDLRKLAAKFGENDIREAGPLLSFLESKAEEFRAYKAQVDAIDERTAGLGNLKSAAQDAANNLDFDEVEMLLSRVQEVELEVAAETAELRARNALLRGRPEQAYTLLTAAADSFAAVDPLEPARRRQAYAKMLYEHGLRYGGTGLTLAAEAWRRAAYDFGEAENPTHWAMVMQNLAVALQNQGTRTAGPEGAVLLDEAVDSYRAAMRVHTEADHPVVWATVMQNLGSALQQQSTRTAGPEGAALLAEAVDSYRAALRVRTEADHPVDWAMAMQNLGSALQQQGTRTAEPEGAALLAEAVDSYRAALRVRTEADEPVRWAMTMQNLGIALKEQGTRTAGPEGAALLAEAVDSFRAALRVRTEADHPVDWAVTMQNLGNALQGQGTRTAGAERAALLAEAIDSYRAALRVRTEADEPVRWAQTMQNLGLALQNQGTRIAGPEGAVLLGQAVDSYRAALRVRTETDEPVSWAMTQENMALLEQARAAHDTCTDPHSALQAALAHVDAALTVYDPDHMPYDYGTATTLRNDLRAQLEQCADEEK